jgi:Zinc knuckle
MRASDSSEPSATSGSDTSDDEKAHPLDSYLAQRQAANEKGENNKKPAERPSPPLPPLHLATSSEESGELPQERDEEDDFDDELLSGSDTTSSEENEEPEEDDEHPYYISSSISGQDSDDEKTEAPFPKNKLGNLEQQTYVPIGVTVLPEGQHADRNAEMIRLLRMRRYFDDDFEENTKRCFKCGAAGHFARDCTNPPRLRSCYLCAEFGHDGRDCPNQLCWKCQRAGHQSRDCPIISHQHNTTGGGSHIIHDNKKRVRAWDEEDTPTVCLKCGRPECSCAGYGDYARAEGGCTNSYKNRDLEKVRCYVCGHRGHLACTGSNKAVVLPPQLPTKLSCYNCGEGGHTAETCRKEKPIPMRAERQRDGGRDDRGGYSTGGRYVGSSSYRDEYRDRYSGDRYDYRQEHHQQQGHYQQQQRHSYGGKGGTYSGGGRDYNSQERRGRYSDYNDRSNKHRRYNDRGGYTEDRSYSGGGGHAHRSGGGGGGDHFSGGRRSGGGGGDTYQWNVHSNAYGALDNAEYNGYDGGDFYETPPQRGGQKNERENKMREKSRFSGGGNQSNKRTR